MSLWIEKQKDGTLIVPLTAKTGNIIGDGLIKVSSQAPDYKRYLEQYKDEQKRRQSDTQKADISHLLTIGKALIERAGARHSSKDTDMVQRMHDLACELGAKCDVKKATGDYFSKPALKADLFDELILRHPGHGNQKVHGNRFGAGQVKESLRRLKDDKEAREKYKATSRKKQGLAAKPVREPGQKVKTSYGETEFSKPATYNGRKRITAQRPGTNSDDSYAGNMKLELNETGKGTNLYRIDNPYKKVDTGYGGKMNETLASGRPLKEAKAIAKIVLDNVETNKPSWEAEFEFVTDKTKQALRDAGYFPK